MAAGLDHLVGSHKERWRDCDSKLLRSPIVDDQLEPCRLSQRHLARPSTSQDLSDLLSCAFINLGCGRAIGHETAGVCEKTERAHHRQVGLDGELGKLLRPRLGTENNVGIHEQCVRMLLSDYRELWQ